MRSKPAFVPSVSGGGAIADAVRGIRHVFVRNLVLECSIGVYRYEHEKRQQVRFNVDLGIQEDGPMVHDCYDDVVCYERIVNRIRSIVAAGHVQLVETMAERVAALCLEDARILSVRVRVEKLDVMTDAEAVGVEIERLQGGVFQEFV